MCVCVCVSLGVCMFVSQWQLIKLSNKKFGKAERRKGGQTSRPVAS